MKTWLRILFAILGNLMCIIALTIPIALLNMLATPHTRGFDPDDTSIALIYKQNTIDDLYALFGAVAIVCVAIVPMEYFLSYRYVKRSKSDRKRSAGYKDWFWRANQTLLPIFGVFFAGLALTGLVTDIIKYMIARPRPCFLHMCKPNYTLLLQPDCKNCGSLDAPGPFWPLCPNCPFVNATQAEEICIQDNSGKTSYFSPSYMKNKWLSCPSGHSSYTFFAMAYLAMFIHRRLGAMKVIALVAVALRPLLVFASMLFALWVALSRVSDHRHHITDVLAGSVLGATIGVWSFLAVTVRALNAVGGFEISPRSTKSRNNVVNQTINDENVESGPPSQLLHHQD